MDLPGDRVGEVSQSLGWRLLLLSIHGLSRLMLLLTFWMAIQSFDSQHRSLRLIVAVPGGAVETTLDADGVYIALFGGGTNSWRLDTDIFRDYAHRVSTRAAEMSSGRFRKVTKSEGGFVVCSSPAGLLVAPARLVVLCHMNRLWLTIVGVSIWWFVDGRRFFKWFRQR